MNWCDSSTDSYSLDGRSEIVGCLKLVFDLIVFYMQYFKIILIHSALIKLYIIYLLNIKKALNHDVLGFFVLLANNVFKFYFFI